MEVPVSLKECQPGVFECAFSPKCIGRHYVLVSIANVAVPGTPFVVCCVSDFVLHHLRFDFRDIGQLNLL